MNFLPKEVKCCVLCASTLIAKVKNRKEKLYPWCKDNDCPCHSPNTEVMGEEITGASTACCEKCWVIDPHEKVQAHCADSDCPCHSPNHSPDEDPALVEIDRRHNNETGEELAPNTEVMGEDIGTRMFESMGIKVVDVTPKAPNTDLEAARGGKV